MPPSAGPARGHQLRREQTVMCGGGFGQMLRQAIIFATRSVGRRTRLRRPAAAFQAAFNTRSPNILIDLRPLRLTVPGVLDEL